MFMSSRLSSSDKKRLLVCLLLIIGSTLFWSSFDQQPTSFNLFADRYTDLEVMGFHIPSIWFQSLNPLFILLLAPIISILWVKLGTKGLEPNSMVKFALGMLLAAAGFGLMIMASKKVKRGFSTAISSTSSPMAMKPGLAPSQANLTTI